MWDLVGNPEDQFSHNEARIKGYNIDDSSMFLLLAHLSRQAHKVLSIEYPCSVVRRSSVRRVVRAPFSKISSETAWLIKAKFHVVSLWERGTKVCINGSGHMTKMDFTPIYSINLKKTSSPEPEVL